MKKLLICLLACALLLSACSFAPTRVRDDDEKENDRPSAENTLNTTAPADYGTVTFDHHYEMQEWAVITCTNRDGSIRWQKETDHYEIAQLSQVVHIGQYEDQYYYIEDGAVIALNTADGSLLWKNADFYGSPLEDCVFIGQTGRIYLSGYFGPEFAVIEPDGTTVTIMSSLSDVYYWPCRLEVDEDAGVATVHMSAGPEGDTGSGDTYPITVDIPE